MLAPPSCLATQLRTNPQYPHRYTQPDSNTQITHEKLFCYVDESGQDTTAQPSRNRVFIVAVAIFEDNRHELEKVCEQYERDSGRRRLKWHKSNPESRLAYWRLIIADERFRHALCYAREIPPLRPEFDARTILSIAKAVQWKASAIPSHQTDYTSDIYIDGISATKQIEYANQLRKIGIHVRRVHRTTDDSHALARLADALAGLARLALEGHLEASQLLQRARRKGIISEV